MRAFCRAAKGKIKQVDYIITHFNPCRYQSVVSEMDALLGEHAVGAQSICVMWGSVKKRYTLSAPGASSVTKSMED